MNLGAHMRAKQLYEFERYDEALQEYVKIAQDDSEDSAAVSMIALCEAGLGQGKRAIKTAQRAVAMAPDDANTHFVLGLVLAQAGKARKAEKALDEAIRLDPDDAENLTFKATARAMRGDWRGAREWSRRAIEVDPDNLGAQEIYAQALALTGNVEEARAVGARALYENPDSADAHCTNGDIYLRQGQHRDAARHFREALRLEPNNEHAVEGMARAMRSVFPLYRWMLMGRIWLAGQGAVLRVSFIVIAIATPRVLRWISRENPALAPYLLPVGVLVILVYWFAWLGDSLLNIVLVFHPFGRYVLKRHQRTEAIMMVGFVALAIVGGVFAIAGVKNAAVVAWTPLIGLILVALATNIESSVGLRKWLVWCLGVLFYALTLVMLFGVLIMPQRPE